MIYKDSTNIINEAKDALDNYYDPYCGRFVIPIDDVNGDITEAILSLLKNGFAMFAYEDSNVCNYILFSIADDCKGFGEVNKCKEVLRNLLGQFGLRYFDKLPLQEYATNNRAPVLIDYILKEGSLLRNKVDGYSLVLVVEDDSFKLIEVLDACI